MPEFANPFIGNVPERLLTKDELVRALRFDIAAEHEATHIYMAQAEATDDPLARAVLIDIANEEREHIGEFMRVLSILTGDEDQLLAHGIAEVDAIAAGLTSGAEGAEPPAETDGETTSAGAAEGEAGGGAAVPPALGSLRP